MAAAQGGGGTARPELGPEALGSATVEPAAVDAAAPNPAVQRAELRPLMAASMRLGESW